MTTTPQPPAGKGRGAWTRFGGLLPGNSGGAFYRLARTGEQQVGSAFVTGADRSDAARAVSLGTKVVQRLAGVPLAGRDGWYGPITDTYVKTAQAKAGVVADGLVGPATMRAWLTPYIISIAGNSVVPVQYLGGIIAVESVFDPAAVGYDTPDDKGLVQLNLPSHPDFSYDQAFDYTFAIPWAGAQLRRVHDAYARTSKADPWLVAVLSHNSPRNAQLLATTGQYPTEQAQRYVMQVLGAW